MATRTISTKVAVEGEGEYSRSVQKINSAIKTLKTQLSLTEAQFKGNANSMQALQAKGETLSKMQEQYNLKLEEAKNALQKCQDAQQRYTTEVKECDDRLKKAEAVQGNNSAAVKKYREELDEARAKLDAAERGVDKWQQRLNAAQRDLINLNRETEQNKKYLDEARQSTDGLASSIDEYGREVRDAGEDSEDFGNSSSGAIEALASALAAAGVTASLKEIAEALRECVAAARDFEKGMHEVFTLLPKFTRDARESMSADMIRFSTDMNVLTGEAVPALYQAISSGVPSNNVFSFMETAQKAAVGGVTDLKTSVDGLTSIVNAYGSDVLTVEEVADDLFTTIRLGKTNFEELAQSIYNVVPIAASAGVSLKDVAAALAAITARGTPTAVATTQLRQVIAELTKEGTKAYKNFKNIAGVSFLSFIKQGHNLQDALRLMEQRANDTGVTINSLFRSIEAGQAAISLTGDATARFTDFLQQMDNSAGSADTAYRTMADTAEYQSKRVQVSLDNIKASIGDALLPTFREVSSVGADILEWGNDVIAQNPWLVQAFAALTAGLAAMVATSILTSAQFTKLIGVVKLLGAAMLANPIALAAAAITTAIAAFVMYSASIDNTANRIRELNKQMDETIKTHEELVERTQSDTAAKIANLEAVSNLLPEIEELNNKESRTQDEQHKLNGLVAVANELYPGLIGAVNELTGAYDINSNSIKNNIEALKLKLEIEANQEIIADKYRRIADLKVLVLDAEKELELAEEDHARRLVELEDKRQEVLTDYAELSRLSAQAYSTGNIDNAKAQLKDLNDQINKLINDADSLISTNIDLQNEIKKTGSDTGKLSDDTDGLAQGYRGLADSVADTSKTLSGLASDLDSAAHSYSEMSQAQEVGISTAIGLQEEYANLVLENSDLLAQYPELYAALDANNTIQQNSAEIAKSIWGIKKQILINELEAQAENIKAQIENYQSLKDSAVGAYSVIAAAAQTALYFVSPTASKLVGGMAGNMPLPQDEEYNAEYQDKVAQLANIQAQIDGLLNTDIRIDNIKSTAGGRSSSGGSSKASTTEKTQAELELEQYKETSKELKYLRDMDLIDDEEYYRRKGEAVATLLKNNEEERRAFEVELHNYRKGEYDRKSAELELQYKTGQLSWEQYLKNYTALGKQYLTKNSEEWLKYEEQCAGIISEAYKQEKAELQRRFEAQEITREEYLTLFEQMEERFLTRNSEQWLEAEEERRLIILDSYNEEKADQEFFRDMGIITEQEYIVRLSEIRDKYLEENSEAWRRATLEINNFLRQQADQMVKEEEDRLQKRRTAEAAAAQDAERRREEEIKAAVQRRIDLIKQEQQAEEDRLNALLDGIDQEIDARRRLRQEESDQDKIATAQKRLDAAKGLLEMARTEADRIQAQREVQRRQEELDKALQDKEDNDWYAAKNQEKADIQAKLEEVRKQAQEAINKAEAQVREEFRKAEEDAVLAYNDALNDRRWKEAIEGTQESMRAAAAFLNQTMEKAAHITGTTTNQIIKNNTVNTQITTAGVAVSPQGIAKQIDRIFKRLE